MLASQAELFNFRAPKKYAFDAQHPLVSTLHSLAMLGEGNAEMILQMDADGAKQAADAAKALAGHGIATIMDLSYGLQECAVALRAVADAFDSADAKSRHD